MSRWVILGAGYTGARLARRLVGDGREVWVTRRSEGAAREVASRTGAYGHAALSLSDAGRLAELLRAGDTVVDSVPPQQGTEGERALVEACAAAGCRRLIYLASTGVYPAAAGGRVDEDSPTGPSHQRGLRRLAAETAILEGCAELGVAVASLRIAGIYGPGRGVHARLAKADYRVIGAGDTLVNRIHVDDLVAAILCVATVEPLPHRIFNVADDDPAGSREVGDFAADLLGVPRPPSVAPEAVSKNVSAMLGADRSIDNFRIKSLGFELRYPSWRQGIPAAAAEDGLIPMPID